MKGSPLTACLAQSVLFVARIQTFQYSSRLALVITITTTYDVFSTSTAREVQAHPSKMIVGACPTSLSQLDHKCYERIYFVASTIDLLTKMIALVLCKFFKHLWLHYMLIHMEGAHSHFPTSRVHHPTTLNPPPKPQKIN